MRDLYQSVSSIHLKGNVHSQRLEVKTLWKAYGKLISLIKSIHATRSVVSNRVLTTYPHTQFRFHSLSITLSFLLIMSISFFVLSR